MIFKKKYDIIYIDINMALYGSGNEDTVITEYLDSHLEEGITQKNLDFILDLIDEYCELAEAQSNEILD